MSVLGSRNPWKFSPVVEAAFRKAGWTPDRNVEVAETVEKLTALGFRMSEESLRIHRAFAGLLVHTPRGSIRFNVLFAADAQDEAIQFWETQLGTRLSPIFEHSQSVLALLAEDGRVFGIHQPCFFDVAGSFRDALDVYFHPGKQIEEFASMIDAFRVQEDIASMLDEMAKDPKKGFRKPKHDWNS